VSEDEVIDGCKEGDFFAVRHAGFGECFEALLHVAHGVEAGGRGEHGDERPGMAEEESVRATGDRYHCGLRAFWERGQEGLAQECVVHDGDEIVLGFDVVVEAHGADVELLRDASHGYGLEALRVGDLQGGGGDDFAAEICVLP
jgi:hypothetical protein